MLRIYSNKITNDDDEGHSEYDVAFVAPPIDEEATSFAVIQEIRHTRETHPPQDGEETYTEESLTEVVFDFSFEYEECRARIFTAEGQHATLIVNTNNLNIEDDEPAETAWEKIKDHITSIDAADAVDNIEQIIDSIPAGDPIIGCLVRSGISTIVGRAAKCFLDTNPDDSFWRRVKDARNCLIGHGVKIATNIVVKTIRCLLKAGF